MTRIEKGVRGKWSRLRSGLSREGWKKRVLRSIAEKTVNTATYESIPLCDLVGQKPLDEYNFMRRLKEAGYRDADLASPSDCEQVFNADNHYRSAELQLQFYDGRRHLFVNTNRGAGKHAMIHSDVDGIYRGDIPYKNLGKHVTRRDRLVIRPHVRRVTPEAIRTLRETMQGKVHRGDGTYDMETKRINLFNSIASYVRPLIDEFSTENWTKHEQALSALIVGPEGENIKKWQELFNGLLVARTDDELNVISETFKAMQPELKMIGQKRREWDSATYEGD
ncbi:hypothetical protein K2P56_03910 [Patescibacteria group bacterium]|nr:hypothetical protein [Patescibacteria group bacterium]